MFRAGKRITLDFPGEMCYNTSRCEKHAGIAQSVEQLIRNQQVVCSSHITSSTRKPLCIKGLRVFLFSDTPDRKCKRIEQRIALPPKEGEPAASFSDVKKHKTILTRCQNSAIVRSDSVSLTILKGCITMKKNNA